ncbi:ABC transporter ATP-binding protein [Pleionea sediminis]|uniref:ABC transporter ATP-binding protein n=1 Tax=Pleionea sediminis TaxID=2569479 RepID=UPI0011867748|nr:dipeptide ABC transporter ATP-binding protein [Pleionea sediminis]
MTDLVLSVENISKTYKYSSLGFRQQNIFALDNISFKLRRGQTLAIVGESGSGKSTLARLLVGCDNPTTGKIFIEEQDVFELSKSDQKKQFKKIRMVFQNPYSSLNPHARIGTTLEEPLKINTNLSSHDRKLAVKHALKRVGLREEHASRFPHMFSGGQQQRIAIARALILNPDVIVADEPLSALDVSVQAQILNLLMDLQEELKISYVFISHDLGVVEHISDQVLVMYRGKLMEYGEVDQIFDHSKHPYTRKLLSSTPSYRHTVNYKFKKIDPEFKKLANLKSGCVFASRCSYAEEKCIDEVPKTRFLKGHRVTCHWPRED